MIKICIVRNYTEYLVYSGSELHIKAIDKSTWLKPEYIEFYSESGKLFAHFRGRWIWFIKYKQELVFQNNEKYRIMERWSYTYMSFKGKTYCIKQTSKSKVYDLFINQILNGHMRVLSLNASKFTHDMDCQSIEDGRLFAMMIISTFSFDVN